MAEFSLEIKINCEDCDNELVIYITAEYGITYVGVEPCKQCIEEAKLEAVQEYKDSLE